MRRNTVKAHACIVGAPAPGRHIVGTQKWHTRGKHRERILPFTREWLVRFASAENGYKAPAAAETEYKAPAAPETESRFAFLSKSSPHTQVRLHPCGLACHVPRRRRLNSHRAQLPLHHTPAALRTRCAPHHSHPTTYLHFRSSNAPLPYSFVIKPSTGR